VASYAKQLNLRLPLLLDADGAVSAAYSVRATPTYMFIDKTGVLQAQIVGKPRSAVLERNLALIMEIPQSEVQLSPPTEETTQDEGGSTGGSTAESHNNLDESGTRQSPP
jgi:hypothetical protein